VEDLFIPQIPEAVMAETSQTTTNTSKAAQRAQEPAGDQASLEGEARSFQERAGAATGHAAREAAEAGRHIAETSRQAGREAAHIARSALEPWGMLHGDLNRWVDDMWRQMAGFSMFPTLRTARPFAMAGPALTFGLPATDIRETEQAYTLVVELPGLTRQDVEISIEGDVLQVQGHKAEEKEDAGATYRVSERRFGRFERSFPLPKDVDRSAIDANFQDGLLKITLPKTGEAAEQRSKIAIRG
jgi:HSP20 family protein